MQVPVVQLVHAAREQHPLQVLAAVAVREVAIQDVAVRDALRKGTREARDHRLAELDLMRPSKCQARWSAVSLRVEQGRIDWYDGAISEIIEIALEQLILHSS